MPGKILIVDDLATNRIILKVKLNAACHETLQASTGAQALEIVRQDKVKLIVLDMVLPDISGIEVCRRLRADPTTRFIPVVMITATGDSESRLAALAAGADEFLTKPLNDVILLARIRSLLRAHDIEREMRQRCEEWGGFELAEGEATFSMPGRVGLIAGDPATGLAWRSALSPHLDAKLACFTPTAALGDLDVHTAPDLFLIAADLKTYGSGLRLISDLRSREPTRHAALSLALNKADTDTAAMALDVGASDLITLPFDPREMALRIKMHIQRKQRADRLRRSVNQGLRLASIDPLTGLFNRRYALMHLARIAAQARQNERRFAVMILDLDRFKLVNDLYGHAAGDAVLEGVAKRLSDSVRPTDMVARIGGEEFLVALPEATLGSARAAAERLCAAISASPIRLPGSEQDIAVTISVGLALGPDLNTLQADQLDARDTLARADAALLTAKTDGRNQVMVSNAA